MFYFLIIPLLFYSTSCGKFFGNIDFRDNFKVSKKKSENRWFVAQRKQYVILSLPYSGLL